MNSFFDGCFWFPPMKMSIIEICFLVENLEDWMRRELLTRGGQPGWQERIIGLQGQ